MTYGTARWQRDKQSDDIGTARWQSVIGQSDDIGDSQTTEGQPDDRAPGRGRKGAWRRQTSAARRRYDFPRFLSFRLTDRKLWAGWLEVIKERRQTDDDRGPSISPLASVVRGSSGIRQFLWSTIDVKDRLDHAPPQLGYYRVPATIDGLSSTRPALKLGLF